MLGYYGIEEESQGKEEMTEAELSEAARAKRAEIKAGKKTVDEKDEQDNKKRKGQEDNGEIDRRRRRGALIICEHTENEDPAHIPRSLVTQMESFKGRKGTETYSSNSDVKKVLPDQSTLPGKKRKILTTKVLSHLKFNQSSTFPFEINFDEEMELLLTSSELEKEQETTNDTTKMTEFQINGPKKHEEVWGLSSVVKDLKLGLRFHRNDEDMIEWVEFISTEVMKAEWRKKRVTRESQAEAEIKQTVAGEEDNSFQAEKEEDNQVTDEEKQKPQEQYITGGFEVVEPKPPKNP